MPKISFSMGDKVNEKGGRGEGGSEAKLCDKSQECIDPFTLGSTGHLGDNEGKDKPARLHL